MITNLKFLNLKMMVMLLMLVLLASSVSALSACYSVECTGKYGNWRAYSNLQWSIPNGTFFAFTNTLIPLTSHMKGDSTDNQLMTFIVSYDVLQNAIYNITKPDSVAFKIYTDRNAMGGEYVYVNTSVLCADDWLNDGICYFAVELQGWKKGENLRQETLYMPKLSFYNELAVSYYTPDMTPSVENLGDYYVRVDYDTLSGQLITLTSQISGLVHNLVVFAFWIIRICLLVITLVLPFDVIIRIYRFAKKQFSGTKG